MFARFFRSFALKHALVAIADFLANGWTKHKETVGNFLASLDDKFESSTGLNIPDSWQAWYDKMVLFVVGKVDTLASTKDFWRRVLAVIQDLEDPKKREALLDEVASLNIGEAVTSAMSAELAEIYNQVKHGLAERFVKASVANNPPPPPLVVDGQQAEPALLPPSDEKISADIKNAAKIQPILHVGEPVTPDLMQQLIKESQERKARLAK